MSAPINPEVQIIFTAIDQLTQNVAAMTTAVNTLNQSVSGVSSSQKGAQTSVDQHGISMRRLALDFRMISIATSIFRREIGASNPIIDGATKALLIFSTTITMATAVTDLATKANLVSSLSFTALSASIGSATAAAAAFIATPIGAVITAIVAVIAAVVALGTYFAPAAVATRQFQQELDTLKDKAEDTKVAIDRLKYGMEGLQVVNQVLRIQEMEIRNAIDRRGYATKEEEQAIKGLTAVQGGLNLEMEKQRLITMKAEYALHGYELRIDDINRTIKELPSFGFSPGAVYTVPEEEEPYGQRGFAPTFLAIRQADVQLPFPRGRARETAEHQLNVTRAVLEEARMGEMGAMLTANNMGSATQITGTPIAISISLAGAIISTEIDMEGALRRSAATAALEIKRRL